MTTTKLQNRRVMIIIKYKEVVDYIIRTVQNESSSFQYIVGYSNIESIFHVKFNKLIIEQVKDMLEQRKEVADVEVDGYGFDVVLYTDYAPNYVRGEI